LRNERSTQDDEFHINKISIKQKQSQKLDFVCLRHMHACGCDNRLLIIKQDDDEINYTFLLIVIFCI
jgi:hypothetical protein